MFTAALGLAACAAPTTLAAETSTPTASATPTLTATPTAEPTPTTEPTPITEAEAVTVGYTSCDEIITPTFAQSLAETGWVGWNMVGQEIGHSPFDIFPSGAPDGQLSCRYGSGPDVPTDNVIDLAWAPVDAATSDAAQAALADAGYERINVTDGVQWALRAEGYWADEEGFGTTYHFTGDEVRWAQIRDELSLILPAS